MKKLPMKHIYTKLQNQTNQQRRNLFYFENALLIRAKEG